MKTEGAKCSRCMTDLEWDVVYDFEDESCGTITHLRCPNCGARYECMEPIEHEKFNYEFYMEGDPTSGRIKDTDIMNGHCTNCGGKVFVTGNFMLSDYDDTVTEDEDCMNYVLSECPYCGMNEVRWDTPEIEKKNLPYWKED